MSSSAATASNHTKRSFESNATTAPACTVEELTMRDDRESGRAGLTSGPRGPGALLTHVCWLVFGFACASDPELPPAVPPPDGSVAIDSAREASADHGSEHDGSADDSSVVDIRADQSTDIAADLSLDQRVPDRSEDPSADASIDGRIIDSSGDQLEGASPDGMLADQGPTDVDAGPTRAATCSVDQPCVKGDCIGSSCDKVWNCFSHFNGEHPCPTETIPYCGCDGKTYFFPITCPEVPYLHAGACGDGVNCDRNDVRCIQPEPDCGPGRVASVVGTCFGPCVPITSCRCMFQFECPQNDLYTCSPEQRCDVQPSSP